MRKEYTIYDIGLSGPIDESTNLNEVAKLIKKIIQDNVKVVKEIKTAKRYYETLTDITTSDEKSLKAKIDAVDNNPLRTADNRVPSNYHQILVDQKASYLFGTMVLIHAKRSKVDDAVEDKQASQSKSNTDGTEVETQSIQDLFDERLSELSTKLHRLLYRTCVEASNTGVTYPYVYINELGEFQVIQIDSEELIPIKGVTIEKKLMYMVRHYNAGKIRVIELYTNNEVITWNNEVFKSREPLISDGNEWSILPFVEFNNNPFKLDDLHKYKMQIDVYDKTISLYANDIEDMQQLIFVLVNYGGIDLNEFLDDLKKYKVVNLDANGKLESLEIKIPVEARIKLLEIIDKSIWMFGQGVDPRMENLGNLSGTALQQLYGLLELKASQTESEFREGISTIVDLYKQYLAMNGDGDFGEVATEQVYTRTAIANTKELIDMVQASMDILSLETNVANHPWVDNPKEELKRIIKENLEAVIRQQQAFGLSDDVKTNTSTETKEVDEDGNSIEGNQ